MVNLIKTRIADVLLIAEGHYKEKFWKCRLNDVRNYTIEISIHET